MPDTTELAELIAGEFYNDRFDLSARGMAPQSAWSLMPEVEVTQKLRGLCASDRVIRFFFDPGFGHGPCPRRHAAVARRGAAL